MYLGFWYMLDFVHVDRLPMMTSMQLVWIFGSPDLAIRNPSISNLQVKLKVINIFVKDNKCVAFFVCRQLGCFWFFLSFQFYCGSLHMMALSVLNFDVKQTLD
jgi:hypothetical protein